MQIDIAMISKKDLTLIIISSILSLIPIFVVIPRIKDELRMKDNGNYVQLIISGENSDWAVFYRQITLFFISIFNIELTPSNVILILRYTRFISIFLIHFSIYALVLLKSNFKNKKLLYLIFVLNSLSYPEKFLLELFRIRLLLAISIFVFSLFFFEYLNYLFLVQNCGYSNVLIKLNYGQIVLASIISFLIHEAVAFTLVGYVFGYGIVKLWKSGYTKFIEIGPKIIVLSYLLFPLVFLFLPNINIPSYNYEISLTQREFPFPHYYILNTLILALLLISISFLTNLEKIQFDNKKNRTQLEYSLIFFFTLFVFKGAMYIVDPSRLFASLFIVLIIFAKKFNIHNGFPVIIIAIIFVNQFFSIQMQFWHFSIRSIHLENQLDTISFYFLPLIITMFSDLKSEFKLKILPIKVSEIIKKLRNIQLQKLITVLFLALITTTPIYIGTRGYYYLPSDTYNSYDQEVDILAVEMLKIYSKIVSKNPNTVLSEYPEWDVALTNGEGLRIRLMALTGYFVQEYDLTEVYLGDPSWYRNWINDFEKNGAWLFYLQNIPTYVDLSNILAQLNYTNYYISQNAQLILLHPYVYQNFP